MVLTGVSPTGIWGYMPQPSQPQPFRPEPQPAWPAPRPAAPPTFGGVYPTDPPTAPQPVGSGIGDALKSLFGGIVNAFKRAYHFLQMGDWRATAYRYGLQADPDNVWNFLEETKTYAKDGTVGPGMPGRYGGLQQLQTDLVRLGYLQYLTGSFDQATGQAVVLFKKTKGLHQSYKAADGNWAVNEYANADVMAKARDYASRPLVVTYQMQHAAASVAKALDNIGKNFKYVKPVMKFLGMSTPDPDTAEAFFRDAKVAMEPVGRGEQPAAMSMSTQQIGQTLGAYAYAAYGILQMAKGVSGLVGYNNGYVVKAVDDTLVDLSNVSYSAQVFSGF